MSAKSKLAPFLILVLCLFPLAAAAQPNAAIPPAAPAQPDPPPSAMPAADAPVSPPAVPSLPPRQPAIEVPAEPAMQPPTDLPRETPIENPLGRAPAIAGSAFGGYGEMTLNKLEGQPAIVDLRRVVLYFGHNFSERLRFYSEVEVEHAIASAGDQGEVAIEQAFLDGLISRRFNLRGGLILMPVGIVNIYHEPPTFNGVDRPLVDLLVIPTTWREAGVGIFGEIAEGLRYQAYLVNGFNANGFTAESGLEHGHQEAQLARAGDFGGIARLDYEPRLGTNIGASAYYATSGNTLRDAVGKVPVSLLEIDARTRFGGFTARAQFAAVFIGDAAALNTALVAAGSKDGPVSAQSRGGYVEAGYDLLRAFAPALTQTLTLFGRYDYVDTQASVPEGFMARPEFRRHSLTPGLVFRPIPHVALKLDYRRHFFGEGDARNEVATAITWMF
ncbi:MAG TPA: TonB-dependent receptor [Polyangia bacterium]|jgi:hypothetical protein|nr:TonB-dependent receptor [Polyangia bacterium]